MEVKDKLERIGKMTVVEDMAVELLNLVGYLDDSDAIETITAIASANQVQGTVRRYAEQTDSLGAIGNTLRNITNFNANYFYRDAYGHYYDLTRNQVELIIEDVLHYIE